MHNVPHLPSLPIVAIAAVLTSYSLPSSAYGPEARYASKSKQVAERTQQSVETDYGSRLKGSYDLWQDGEGGPRCAVTLGEKPIRGCLTLIAGEDCASKLALKGHPYAWFINPDGQLIIIDEARQALLRMNGLDDGSYKDPRDGDYVNAVLLTRPNTTD
jgi:hypothetical protein